MSVHTQKYDKFNADETIRPELDYTFFVVGDDYQVKKMLRDADQKIALKFGDPWDIIVFTGGADICPYFYGERFNPKTQISMVRDLSELRLYHRIPHGKPKVGICRGAQFLNVMSGGSMWQDVSGHAIAGYHWMDTWDNERVQVTSTHHQMMRPGLEAWILGTAEEAEHKETATECMTPEHPDWDADAEAIYYGNTNSFCFQPHPEYSNRQCRKIFFDWIDMLFLKEIREKREKQKTL